MKWNEILAADLKKRSVDSEVFCEDIDLETGEPIILVQQQYKDECDLNWILNRLTPEDIEERRLAAQGVYADFTNVMDYGEAKMLVAQCDAAFMSLSPKIRSRFDNDPNAFIEFMEDSQNDEEAVRLGLKSADVLKSAEAPATEPKGSES